MIADLALRVADAIWRTADGIRAAADRLEHAADVVNGLGHRLLDGYSTLADRLDLPTQEEIDAAIRAGIDPDELRDLDAAAITVHAPGAP